MTLKSTPGLHLTYGIVHDLSQGLIDILLLGARDCEAEVEISFANLGLVGTANVTNLAHHQNKTAMA